VDKLCHPQRPAQKRLVQALSAPSDNTLEGQYRRRNDAMDAVITYCVVEEGSTIRRSTVSAVKSSQGATTSDPQESHLRLALRSVFVIEKTERARRCFVCVGKALSVAQTMLFWTTSSTSFTWPATLPNTSDAGTCPIYKATRRSTAIFVRSG
jgi:hypothetical protein